MDSDRKDLDAYVDENATDGEQEVEGVAHELMVFEFQGFLFGLPVGQVDSVIPWAAPAPIPQGPRALRGVIQDQGRIIAVMGRPDGDASKEASANDPSRIVVCATKRGLVGLPSENTRHVGKTTLASEPTPGEPVSSDLGVIVFLDADGIAEKLA